MPETPADPLSVPLPDLSVADARSLLKREWGLDGDLTPLHGERDLNFRLDTVGGSVLLKLHNAADREPVVDMQSRVLEHLGQTAPGLPLSEIVRTRTGMEWAAVTDRSGRPSLAQVMTWLPGHHPRREEFDAAAWRRWGAMTARLAVAMRGFVHPAAAYPIAWDIRRLPLVRGWADAVAPEQRDAVDTVFDRWQRTTAAALRGCRAQILHNDIAPGNVLVDDSLQLSGITDFGDMTHTAVVCDLAVAIADVTAGHPDWLDILPVIASGYQGIAPVEPEEIALLPDLMAGRCVAALVITAWRIREQGSAPPVGGGAWHLLRAILDQGFDAVARRLVGVRPTAGAPPYPERPSSELMAARSRTFGGQALSYGTPLHLVEGHGVWLRAADGRRYLDAYNNVPVLGHGHPAVVAAVSSQLARLNTNTRYLQDAPVALAERLLATLPARFDRVLLVNSGSEANDLAWRIARHATGGSGGLATRFAYHGVTEATFAFSPESWGPAPRPQHIRLVVPPPLPPAAGTGVAGGAQTGVETEIAAAAADLAAAGHRPAMLIVDGLFTSDGIRGPAHDWTRQAAAAVHAAGGLYVADEVQAGFGRTGDALWSFVAGGFHADLVTLGKPMGNGYPVAAVAGPAELIDPFVAGTDYFSTFGGATAACVAALTVLAAIESEDIVARAADVGRTLRQSLSAVAGQRDDLAVVRGWGLAVGVDVVDPGTGRADAGRAKRIVDGMRARGVLIGRASADRATLKIRPPLIFAAEHVELVAAALAATAG